MIAVTCDLNSIPEPFSLLTCNCMALLIVAIIAACVKLIRIVCEYTSPSSCCVQYLAYLEVAILAKQLSSLLLYSHNLVYTYLATIHH